jgi:hypothetical protein
LARYHDRELVGQPFKVKIGRKKEQLETEPNFDENETLEGAGGSTEDVWMV